MGYNQYLYMGYIRVISYNPLIPTFDPNFLEHPGTSCDLFFFLNDRFTEKSVGTVFFDSATRKFEASPVGRIQSECELMKLVMVWSLEGSF